MSGGHGGLLAYGYDDVISGAVREEGSDGASDRRAFVDFGKDYDDTIALQLELATEKRDVAEFAEALGTIEEGAAQAVLSNYLSGVETMLQIAEQTEEPEDGIEKLTREHFELNQSEVSRFRNILGLAEEKKSSNGTLGVAGKQTPSSAPQIAFEQSPTSQPRPPNASE